MSLDDWKDAEEALIGKPNGTTLSKYPTEPNRTEPHKIKWLQLRKHTVVIIDGMLYALSKKEDCRPLIQGNLIFRKGLSQYGKEVIIQIKDLHPQENTFKENLIKKTNDMVDAFGFCEKTLATINHLRTPAKEYEKAIFPKQRIYSLVKNPSKKIVQSLDKNQILSPTQKMIASLRICLLMQELHSKGVLYRNIMAENFALTINDQDIQAKFTNFMFCHSPESKPAFFNSLMLDWIKLIGFIGPEMYSQQNFTVFSDYFSLAVMLFFQIDITGNNIPDLYFNKYIDAACQAYELQGKLINPIEWIEINKIEIESELKEILFSMLHPYPGERKSIHHLITYLCEKLLLNKEINMQLKQELELLLNKYKPFPPTMIFSPFQMPDIFSPLVDDSVVNKNRLSSYF